MWLRLSSGDGGAVQCSSEAGVSRDADRRGVVGSSEQMDGHRLTVGSGVSVTV
jgi:hypothetical protein